MKIAVVGGRLQGVEACYLAHRAGWNVVLIDRRPDIPARGLCDTFVSCDIVHEPEKFSTSIEGVELIIPAMEDTVSLGFLAAEAEKKGISLAFDLEAYAVTSSKRKSDNLFSSLGLCVPRPWPACELPVIVKPSGSSGSRGVRRINSQEELVQFLRRIESLREDWVVQEYLEGPSYSLEVISREGQCVTLQTTELEMDNSYDCKRVLASGELPESLDRELRRMATILAEALQLTGIMDIEVILNRDRLNILEIDARLPSQTPTAVEMSTGINILELIREVSIESTLPRIPTVDFQRGVVYEHVMVKGDHLEVSGEHIMAGASTLHVEEHFFGADVALTNLVSRDLPWVATLIVSGENRQKAWMRRCGVIEAIMDEFRLSHYTDQAPY